MSISVLLSLQYINPKRSFSDASMSFCLFLNLRSYPGGPSGAWLRLVAVVVCGVRHIVNYDLWRIIECNLALLCGTLLGIQRLDQVIYC